MVVAAAIGCGDSNSGESSATGFGGGTTSTAGATVPLPTTSDGAMTTAGAGSAGATTTGEPTTGTPPADTSTSDATGTGAPTTGAVQDTTSDDTTSDTTTGPVSFCDGEGGILLPGDLSDMCTADLGKKTFLFAVCSCSGLTANNTLKTDSFDSDTNMSPQDGGSVGVNGTYSSATFFDIRGSLWVKDSFQAFNTHEVAHNVQCGGNYSLTSPAHVGNDVFVEGQLTGPDKVLTIDHDLHIAPGKATATANVLNKIVKEQVAVETPCDCSDPIDVASIVQGYQMDNDNIPMAIEPNQLIANPQPVALELPCGRYYFDAISPNNSLSIKLTGRTVIAVAGNIVTPAPFTIELGPGAELDLFVAGDIVLNNVAVIGDTTRPAATRMYLDGALTFSSGLTLGGNLYQPKSMFTANNTAEIWGSLFVGGLVLSSPFTVHYDQAILELDGCEEMGGDCTDCHDCANPTPACKDGSCAPCEQDSDCCPPLVCDFGVCKAVAPG